MWQKRIARPVPNRNFKESQSGSRIQSLPIGDSSWYKISVSIIFL